MSQQKKVGLWLPVSVGAVLLVAGIIYARELGVWKTFFNQPKQTYQTVNTGASVQVSMSTSNSTPIDKASPQPLPEPSPSVAPTNRPKRMW